MKTHCDGNGSVIRSAAGFAGAALLACLGLLCVGCSTNARAAVSARRGLAVQQAAAADGDGAAVQADRGLVAAVLRGDRKAVAALLDGQFAWTDMRGQTRRRTATLRNLQALAKEMHGQTDVKAFPYGRLAVVTSAQPNARFLRVWVLRPQGWRAFATIGTAMAAGLVPFATTVKSAGADCQNPCRTMPYQPVTANQKQIAAIFMRLKRDEWRPNPDDWAPYVLAGVDYVTSGGALSKAVRVGHLAELQKSGAPVLPGDPVISMRIVEFGDAAVMAATHRPFRGGKPYYSLRVWVYRDGRWQLANSQQTTIDRAPAVPALRPRNK
jgi:hypothetical protein